MQDPKNSHSEVESPTVNTQEKELPEDMVDNEQQEEQQEALNNEEPSVIISPQLLATAKELVDINADNIKDLDESAVKESLLHTVIVTRELLNIIENNINVKMTDDQSKQEIIKLKEEVARRTAEIENTRLRVTKNLEEKIKYASTPILKDLIPTIENLDAALSHIPHEVADEAIKNFITGVELTHKKFLETLNSHKIEQIGVVGEQFNPNIHDAIAQIPSDAPEGEIVAVQRKGYRLHDRVITPAQVVISQAK